ncbi:hypothetical protein EX30DRAFT_191621 [Ascodesmis nigricans]|uniref:AN1-type domain-containing protein n=1 Tax=Ascodesmis nigricans TaxID=341454 RepID=A0A4S2N0G6_9PEZI|nr:hypothetical protein EX30DRAFT_191621 [Ascodesmis nigricans]
MDNLKAAEEIGDVQAIGAHCDVNTCNRLDFLPFRCESCQGTFCLDHRTETAHTCSKAGTWLANRTQSSSSSSTSYTPATNVQSLLRTPCALPKCKTIINTSREPGVNCSVCRKQYCLKHRLQDSHECKAPPPPPSAVARERAVEKIKSLGMGRFFGRSEKDKEKEKESGKKASKSALVPKRSGVALAAELAKMKREAKGDEKVPMEKRVYLYTEAEAKTTTAKIPRGVFWYSKDWSVGRVLDVGARQLQIANVNNQGDDEEKRLRIFHVESGRVLSFGEKIGDCALNGNTIVMLRGLMMPDLLS